ncbi:MAG: hypothetical protein P0Y56_10990 [Candidatus Andeanibacterium colombiense]|uniref:TonB C-terminal domain-containing protein n=1 Tax=Candidatus Andeanibacterium colombiense TaxID=3121345 RepID=A0AAJ5X6M9_9SPHN|nr:MAG: hypothetical protein P0Y56_10990 [Sphingomonadaceae bacterium]
MKRVLMAATSCVVLLGAVQPASAAERVYKPAGPWAAEYGDDYCRLARNFSDGTDTLSLAMERIQPGAAVRTILIGNGIKMYRGSNALEYTLTPSGGERKGPFWRSETADKQQYLNLGEIFMVPLGPPPAGPVFPPYDRAKEQEFAKGVSAIQITGGVIDPVTIETGGLKAPIASLQTCADDLLKTWGLDPALHQTMTRTAQPSTEANKWLPTGTIGFGDFGKLGGAANQLRVMVSAEGKPTACVIHWASLEKKTNDAICKAIMDKGQFLPATDKDGKPMASYWMVSPFALMPPFGGT